MKPARTQEKDLFLSPRIGFAFWATGAIQPADAAPMAHAKKC
jgi:hypothetical protein